MRCYIKRANRECYFAKHIGLDMLPNHWVIFKTDAKEFENVKEARKCIKMYKLKNCEVEK